MTSTQQRQTLLPLIAQACLDGARLQAACHLIGLSARTVQRWHRPQAAAGDNRTAELRAKTAWPSQLSPAEREAAMQVLNSADF